ncbi:hypothetical protein [Candidatus Borrarchaeum sp.]|uniref:hypothetical protein n=1 Tax=Candidatus Borrarchaeum sp. TaxID=2846742 RepID=UPI0025797385|nr:hypothetical protein [Candidatus Borrarchaeum sp.]
MAEELLEKIPPEKRWAITAKTLTAFVVLRGDKIIAPQLGIEEGVIAPVMGAEKWDEINDKVFCEGGKVFYPWVKEMFNIPVKDAIGAYKLLIVVETLLSGPEQEHKLVEATPERVVSRLTKCPWWERYQEFDVHSEHRACDAADQKHQEEGLKAVSPKLTFKLTKTRQGGYPYCEYVIELKDE